MPIRHVGRKPGFTIVELLIVIVVIAILAAITVVAYTGITDRARVASVQAASSQAAKKVAAYVAEHGSYPATLAAVSVTNSGSMTYGYRNYGNHSCVAATESGVSYQVIDGAGPVYGNCVDLSMSVYNGAPSLSLAYEGDPLMRTTTTRSALYWGTDSPTPGTPSDQFLVVIEGFLTPPVSGVYTFSSRVDDRDYFYLDNQLVIDGSTTASNAYASGSIALEALKPVPLKWVIRDGAGAAGVIDLTWSYPGQAAVFVPASVFNSEP